jgi:hypothetical protein
MSRRARVPLRDRVSQKLRRTWKFAARHVRALSTSRRQHPSAIFVLGSGRSGTRVPIVVLERSPETITYSEGHSRVFRGALLRDDQVIHSLLKTTPFRTVVLKPICESYRANEFLNSFPNARVVWIFRDYRDAVNSATKKWTSALRHVRSLANGDLRSVGWRAGGMTPEKLGLVRELCTPDLSLSGAHAIMWYLNNSMFFDLQMHQRDDALLVRYEDLVKDPLTYFPELFTFVGSTFDPKFVAGIYDRSIGRDAFPVLPDAIEALCADVHARLLDFYRSRRIAPVGSTQR